MTSASSDESVAIVAAHDFSGYRRIVDVGGGYGALLAAVLDRYSGPLGVLFDWQGSLKSLLLVHEVAGHQVSTWPRPCWARFWMTRYARDPRPQTWTKKTA